MAFLAIHIPLDMDENTPCGVSNKGRCKWGWDLSKTCSECILRSLSGGRQCDGALPIRTVGDMRWGRWAFGWLRRRMVAWLLAFVGATGGDVSSSAPLPLVCRYPCMFHPL